MKKESIFEVETSSIIFDVDNKWRKFNRIDLLHFRQAIDSLLQVNVKDAFSIKGEGVNTEKYLNEIRSEMDRQNDINYSPIPQFIVGYSRVSNSATMIPIEQEIFLTPKSEHFGIFLAFKLALIDGDLISECFEYLAKTYFKGDKERLLLTLDFIIADYETILGPRKIVLQNIFNSIREQEAHKLKMKSKEMDLKNDLSNSPEGKEVNVVETSVDLNSEANLSLRKQVLILHYLFKACRLDGVVEPQRTEVARIMNMILGKKEVNNIGGTNTYKILEHLLTPTEAINVSNLQNVRSIFERLGLRSPIEMIDKELKSSAGF